MAQHWKVFQKKLGECSHWSSAAFRLYGPLPAMLKWPSIEGPAKEAGWLYDIYGLYLQNCNGPALSGLPMKLGDIYSTVSLL
jgi:hypothetical protein